MRFDGILDSEPVACLLSPPGLFDRKFPVPISWSSLVKDAGETSHVIAVQGSSECDSRLKDFAIASSHGDIGIICGRL